MVLYIIIDSLYDQRHVTTIMLFNLDNGQLKPSLCHKISNLAKNVSISNINKMFIRKKQH